MLITSLLRVPHRRAHARADFSSALRVCLLDSTGRALSEAPLLRAGGCRHPVDSVLTGLVLWDDAAHEIAVFRDGERIRTEKVASEEPRISSLRVEVKRRGTVEAFRRRPETTPCRDCRACRRRAPHARCMAGTPRRGRTRRMQVWLRLARLSGNPTGTASWVVGWWSRPRDSRSGAIASR